jgi:hypothetical protein
MEPNKLEKQFKEQLNSREIKPSEMAWSKLDAMLTAADPSNSEQAKQKPKTKFPWIYIAASILGFLLIGTVYFNQKENVIGTQKNDIVIQNEIAPKTTIIPDNAIGQKAGERKSVVATAVQTPTLNTNIIPKFKESAIIKNNQNQVTEVSINNQTTEQKTIKSQTSTVSVDELVAVAGNPLKKENQSGQKSVINVNAGNLLSQVDGELEFSFREKVINKVSKNYQSVKVALANRNLE